MTRYFSTTEAAEYLGLSPERVRTFCVEGRLGRRIGRNWAITESQLQAFAELDRPAGRPAEEDE